MESKKGKEGRRKEWMRMGKGGRWRGREGTKTKTGTNSSPDPNRYRRRCPDPNARIQKISYKHLGTST